MKKFYNKTKVTRSISIKLLKQGKFHLLPIYFLCKLSYLGNEGIENSGSYLFADHIYLSKPKGKMGIGILIDMILLQFPSAKSFRKRFFFAQEQISAHVSKIHSQQNIIRVLSVPCGIPRELIEAAKILQKKNQLSKVQFYCLDLNPVVLVAAEEAVMQEGLQKYFTFIEADAFNKDLYPSNIHVVTSTGFGEFLTDQQLQTFYSIIHSVLDETGVFITSNLDKHVLSDYLLRELGELYTQYRKPDQLSQLIHSANFKRVSIQRDKPKLHTLLTAHKI